MTDTFIFGHPLVIYSLLVYLIECGSIDGTAFILRSSTICSVVWLFTTTPLGGFASLACTTLAVDYPPKADSTISTEFYEFSEANYNSLYPEPGDLFFDISNFHPSDLSISLFM